MKIFGISRDTARRDIVKMVDLGLGLRTHGGIMIKSQERMILDYKERQKEHISLKKEIARKALSYISVHKVIYFDVSTTINALCDLVPSHIIGYTNSLANVESLSAHCETHMIGGKYNPRGRFMFGPDAYKAIEGITFDLCFLGAACVKEDGIYFQDEDDAYMKHLVASRSHFVCVLYDDSKYLKKVRIPAVIIAVAICAATVFVKQHSILDVFAALALSLVLYLIIYVAARRAVDRRQPSAAA